MRPIQFVCGMALIVFLTTGCGPLSRPIPERLHPDDQKVVDASWDHALAPVNKHDRQTWLDVFVLAYAHEHGIDRLSFRSEKDYAEGKVVMEVFFDRAKPDEDRFVVTVLDLAGKTVRTERYNRDDVHRTYRDLLSPDDRPDDPQFKAERQRRIDRVSEIRGPIVVHLNNP